MIPYTMLELLFFFLVYCFIGWIIESTWVSLHQKRFVNRGFMRGPVIPIYGFGAMTLLLVGTPFLKWPVAVFFGGLLACSLLEYVTGALMEAIFKVRYWDYSDKPFNINGHVCLFTSVCWGLLALAEDYVMHKPIERFCKLLTLKEQLLFVVVLGTIFVVDLTLSFKAAFDLRSVIVKMEKAKEELRLMQKRLDVYLAFANESKDNFIDDTKEKATDLLESLESKFASVKKAIEEKPAAFADSAKAELSELRDKFVVQKANKFGLPDFKGFYKRGIILGNPGIKSKKFGDSVNMLREYVEKKKK